MRELRRVYAEVDKFSNLYWSTRDEFELIRTQLGQKRTRSKITEEDLLESKNWQQNTDAQFGYGEITKGAMTTLLNTFQSMSELQEMPKLEDPQYYNMSSKAGSTFLDIGSGFGKPVFHAAI